MCFNFSPLFQQYQYYLDSLTPYVAVRWGLAIATIIIFLWRIFMIQVRKLDIFSYNYDHV